MPSAPPRLLVIHQDHQVRRLVAEAVRPLGEVFTAVDPAASRDVIAAPAVDVALVDPGLVSPGSHFGPATPLISLGPAPASGPAESAGYHAEIPLPPDPRLCVMLARSALHRRRLEREVRRLRAAAAGPGEAVAIKGLSPAMEGVRHTLRAIAESEAPVLILGEPGTGRALAARALHAAGSRREGPLVTVLLSAFAPSALEAELSGRDPHHGGGQIEAAQGGTLLLRDLESLPASLQEPLLRLARSGVWTAPDGSRSRVAGVRLVATAGPGLEAAVSQGRFRQDLLGSLEAVTLHMPSLRERRDDIPLLAEHFLGQLRRPGDPLARRFSQEALEILAGLPWLGNVRELRHVVESVALHSDAAVLGRRDLPRPFQKQPPPGSLPVKLPDGGLLMEQEIAAYEKAMLAMALERTAGRRSEAAGLLGLNKDQMKYLCRKHGL